MNRSGSLLAPALYLVAAVVVPIVARADVVLNEVHYEPVDGTSQEEFLELVNRGDEEVDLSGWFFSNGVDYTFAPGTTLAAGGLLVVAQDPEAIRETFGVEGAHGPWGGRLSNSGERIVLRRADGEIEDQLDYGLAFPWPIASAGDGASMELIDPSLDNDLGGSWRASGMVDDLPQERSFLLTRESERWRFRRGTSEPPANWRALDFVQDDTWQDGQTSIGFGDDDDNTVLDDMEDSYSTIYMRHRFVLPEDREMPLALKLGYYFDDGGIVSINGVEVARIRARDGEVAFDGRARSSTEARWGDEFLPSPGGYLRHGENVVAVHALNSTVTSGDFSADIEIFIPGAQDFDNLVTLPPTPGSVNSVRSPNAPPQVRQVRHAPVQPRSDEQITITAKVTDPQGVASVELLYQVVLPGAYVPAFVPLEHTTLLRNASQPREKNPEFEDPAGWTAVAMVDDGAGGDAFANDGVYTARVSSRPNRALLRYRVRVTDTSGLGIVVPYRDDPSLNFALFVHDGIPPYPTTRRSVHPDGVGHVYPSEEMSSLAVYFVIARQVDVSRCVASGGSMQIPQGNQARFAENWECAFVYDGIVHDHVNFRLRGANGRYQVPSSNPGGLAGKRHWRFKFNKGHHLQAHDRFGNPYPTRWRVLNTGRMFGNRIDGNWGLGDQVNDVLWRSYGVPAPFGHVFHWRMVDGPDETPDGADGQYHGDFWGIARAFENYDSRFLDAHGLPKGNLYKLVNQTRSWREQQRYQAPDAVANGEDHNNIEGRLRGNQPEAWLDAHVDYGKWYRYHAIVQAVRHYDYWPDANKNATWYFHPEYSEENGFLGRMWTLPFDTDATWGPSWNSGIDRPYDAIFAGRRTEMQKQYRNHVRQIRDLLWQEDQLALVIRQVASFMDGLEEPDIDRWKDAPTTAYRQYFAAASQRSLEGKFTDMMRFAFTGGSWPGGAVGAGGRAAFLDSFADGTHRRDLPQTPTASYVGPDGFPSDALVFRTTAFEDPQGAESFAGLQWRIARASAIEDPIRLPLSDPAWRSEPVALEIVAAWTSGEIGSEDPEVTIPSSAVTPGASYRVRVRMKDDTNLWSHWSAPVEITVGEPSSSTPAQDSLRVTELMYHPRGDDGHEFIELRNIGAAELDLSGVRFVEGILFDFDDGDVRSLPPGEFVVLVRNPRVFATRHDASEIRIAGKFEGSLENAGETIALLHGESMTIQRFTYDDAWYQESDGFGASLVIRDPTASPESWGEREGWRAGVEMHGSPGREDRDVDAGLLRVGDVHADGRVDVSDAVALLRHLVAGGGVTLPCGDGTIADDGNRRVADLDGDEQVTTSDAVYLLEFLFRRGRPPEAGVECVVLERCPMACLR